CDVYTFGSPKLTVSGVYYDTLQTTTNCDSVIELSLTINSSTLTAIAETACDVYTFGGADLTVSGVYYDTLQTTTNCDSVIELSLTINTVVTGVDYRTITLGDTLVWIDGNVYTTSNNTATYTYVG